MVWPERRLLSALVERPTGTVTFLFTDIEESTRRWEADAPATGALVASHDQLVRMVVQARRGYVFASRGDGFGVAFQRASDAVAAAVELQESFSGEGWAPSGLRVRMGAHTGEAVERDGDYFGPTVNRTARIMGLAHGGQILLSAVTAGLVEGFDTVELGEYQLRSLARPERLYQVVKAGLGRTFPPLRGERGPAHNLPAALDLLRGPPDRDRRPGRPGERGPTGDPGGTGRGGQDPPGPRGGEAAAGASSPTVYGWPNWRRSAMPPRSLSPWPRPWVTTTRWPTPAARAWCGPGWGRPSATAGCCWSWTTVSNWWNPRPSWWSAFWGSARAWW